MVQRTHGVRNHVTVLFYPKCNLITPPSISKNFRCKIFVDVSFSLTFNVEYRVILSSKTSVFRFVIIIASLAEPDSISYWHCVMKVILYISKLSTIFQKLLFLPIFR